MRQKVDKAAASEGAADRRVAFVASRQHGVVTTRQLLDAGLGHDAVKRRVRSGRLHRIHRGVYAVGHRGLSREGEWKAATLALGAEALLSHRSAAELWGMLKPLDGPIHVTVAGTGGRARRPGLRIHRSLELPGAVRTIRRGIAVTTPTRTIADLRRIASENVVRRAIREAEAQGLPLEGIATDRTRSDLECAFLRICIRHRLPTPEANVRIGRFTVDFLWRAQRLVVEVDGYRYHRGRQAFRDDRERDLELRRMGFAVLRFADATLNENPGGVAAAVRAALCR